MTMAKLEVATIIIVSLGMPSAKKRSRINIDQMT